jgi:hypothetical protein
MNPVLIYTDSEKISDEQETIDNVVTIYQAVYTAIKTLGVTPTLAEIDILVQYAKRQSQTNFINDYILNKLTDAAAPFVLNGISLTRDAVKGMIALPDTTAIKTVLQSVWGFNSQKVFVGQVNGARINLLTLAADVISKVADANTQITNLYTFYTMTDASATMAANLQAVCDALNNFDTNNNDFYRRTIPPLERQYNGEGIATVIPGLDIRNDAFVISLHFMRKYEEIGNLNFVRNS